MHIVSVLYHWAPTVKREQIALEGLKPFQPPTVHSQDMRAPYICLGPSPSAAWALSGDMGWVSEIEEWDLWQVVLPADGTTEVHVRPFFGNHVEEIKVYTPLAPNCLWLVGTREPAVFVS